MANEVNIAFFGTVSTFMRLRVNSNCMKLILIRDKFDLLNRTYFSFIVEEPITSFQDVAIDELKKRQPELFKQK